MTDSHRPSTDHARRIESDRLAAKRRLRRMQAWPTGLLVLMIIVLIGSYFVPLTANAAGYIRAFAEAAIVGALADWFAVVALFSHPMGIPIPHTAIIPNRKDDIAVNLGRFLRLEFFTPDRVAEAVIETDAAARISQFAKSNSRRLAATGLMFARWLLEALESPQYRDFLQRHLTKALAEMPIGQGMAHLLRTAIAEGHHQPVFTEVLRQLSAYLESNRERIRIHITQDKPWWLPDFVDNKIFDQMIERIQTQLLAMILEPDHALRLAFDEQLNELADSLESEGEYSELIGQLRDELMSHPAAQAWLEKLFEKTAQQLARYLEANSEEVTEKVAAFIEQAANDVLDRPDLRVTFNQWLAGAGKHIANGLGGELDAMIQTTVASWDGQETAERLKLLVAADLQFIRINGTIIGGLAGLLIYAISRWFAH